MVLIMPPSPRRARLCVAAPFGRAALQATRLPIPSRSLRYLAAALLAAALLSVIATVAVEADSPSITVVSPANATYFYPSGHVEIAAQISSVHNIVSANASINGGQVTVELTYNSASDQWEGEAALLPGHYSLVASALDDNGDSSASAPVGFTVSQLEVVLNYPSNSSYSSDPLAINASVLTLSPIISVIAEIDGTTNVTLSPSGGYFVGTYPLPEGPHSIRAIAEDSFGRTNSTAAVAFTVDWSPPYLISSSPANGSTTGGGVTIYFIFNDTLSPIDAASVSMSLDGNAVSPSVSGGWATGWNASYRANALSSGSHTVTITVADASRPGNAAQFSLHFTADSAPPSISSLSPESGSHINANSPLISANYSDNYGIDASTVMLRLDGIDVTPSSSVYPDGVSYQPPSPLPDGRHNVTLTVADNNGNTASASWHFYVDTSPPSVVLLSPINGKIYNYSRVLINVSVSDLSSITSVVARINGILDVPLPYKDGFYFNDTIPYPEGSTSITIIATDEFGQSNDSVAATFYVDMTPPIVGGLTPGNGSYHRLTLVTIRANFNDAIAGVNASSVRISLDGVDITSSAAISSTGFSYQAPLPQGSHRVTISISDNIGLKADYLWTFTTDVTPPSLSAISPASGAITGSLRPQIAASYSDNVEIDPLSLRILLDGADVTLYVVVTESNISYQPPFPLSEGVHNVTVSASDYARNNSTLSWTFTVDGTAPSLVAASPANGSNVTSEFAMINFTFLDAVSGINSSSASISLDGSAVPFSASGDDVGGWSFHASVQLADGQHSAAIYVADRGGNVAYAEVRFTVDRSTPSVNPISPINGSIVREAAPTISASFFSPSGISSYYVEVDSVRVNASLIDGRFTLALELADGPHTVFAYFMDNSGKDASATWSFTKDSSPPEILSFSPGNGTALNITQQVIVVRYGDPLSGIDAASARLLLDGQEIAASSNSSDLVSPPLNLSEGNYRVSVFVKDNAGNSVWANWSFLIDLTPPSILQSSISNGSQVASSGLRLAFSYGGNIGPLPGSVKLLIDGSDVTQSSSVNSTSLTYSRPLPAGSHIATLVVTDRAGNTVSSTWEFTVYQDAPPYLELALPVVAVAVALVAFWAYMRHRYGKTRGGATPAQGGG